jgi:DNA-directed RNA polymerase subunit E'/Rpb7
MLVKKILETYLDITNPDDIFSSDLDKTVLTKLHNKFVGICYDSCLILNINKIIRRSYVYMKDTLDGDTNLSVLFEVDCIIYIKDEIINGCKIIKKETNGIMHATSKYAGIQLNIQPTVSIFKEDEIIPVIVKRVRYNISQNSISVLAIPFMPINYTVNYYRISGELTNPEKDNLLTLLDEINIYEESFKKLTPGNKKIYKFFVDLLKQKNIDLLKIKGSFNKINFAKMLELKSNIICKKYNTYDDNIVEYVVDSKDSKDDNVIEETSYNIFNIILIEHLLHLQTLQEFLNHYKTFTDVQNSKNIWKFYSMLKK